jgi:predicted transcriptional regulator of viral defense system
MSKASILSILRSPSTVFSFKEILIAAGQTDAALLKRRLHYYVKKGELYPLRRGLYAKEKHYNKFELATKIYRPSYISFETILAEAGIVFQYYKTIFVATYKTKELECDKQPYAFRKIKDEILTNTTGIDNKGTYFAATKERAFLDILYLHKEYHFDNLEPLDWNKVQSLLPIYRNKRMVKTVARYFKYFENQERLP